MLLGVSGNFAKNGFYRNEIVSRKSEIYHEKGAFGHGQVCLFKKCSTLKYTQLDYPQLLSNSFS